MVGMTDRRDGLLAEIVAGVHDDTVSLASLLQKCVLLGRRTGSEKLREWARQELHGYDGKVMPPEYRRHRAQLKAWVTNEGGFNGMYQPLPASDLADSLGHDIAWETVPLHQGVGELEEIAGGESDFIRLTPSWEDGVVEYLNNINRGRNTRIVHVFWEVARVSIRGMLVRIRTVLAELVAELEFATPEEQPIPDKAATDQAVQLTVTGSNNVLNVSSQHATGGGTNTAAAAPPLPAEPGSWWARLRKRGAVVAFATIASCIVGIASLVVAVFTLLGWKPW
jgi:hypothetical protein